MSDQRFTSVVGGVGLATPLDQVRPSMSYEAESDPLWYVVLQELMCRLYKAFGGDCADLDWGDGGPVALQTVRSAFEEVGPPIFESQDKADAFFSNLEAIDAHLGSPEITISQELAAEFRDLIDDIRAASVL